MIAMPKRKTNHCLNCGVVIGNSSVRCKACDVKYRRGISLKLESPECPECGSRMVLEGGSNWNCKEMACPVIWARFRRGSGSLEPTKIVYGSAMTAVVTCSNTPLGLACHIT